MKPYLKVLRWIPRVLGILAIAFISMFAFDAFSPEKTFWQNVGSLVIHLLPTFILIAFLLVAWKRELTGGIIFTLIGLAAIPFISRINSSPGSIEVKSLGIALVIALPFLITGILFIVSYYVNRRLKAGEHHV